MKNKRKEITLKYMLTYEGKPISPYNYYHIYNEGDYICYNDIIFKSIANFNTQRDPISNPFSWERITHIGPNPFKEQKKKPEIKKICGNHIGSIFGDNVVIYGDNNGNISANGEKSVVVVFGDVTGNITAEQVIRFDNSNMDAVKTMILKERGKNNA